MIFKKKIAIKDAKISQEDFNKYLQMIQKGNKREKQKRKRCQILIFFLMGEMMLSHLYKTMFQ